MGRPKTISDEDAINLVNQYFTGPCAGVAERLNLPDIANYIRQNGYPSYRVETLRRSPVVRRHIESLLSTVNKQARVKLVSYKSLDIEALLDNNRTRGALTKALTDIDMYYKTIADTSAEIIRNEQKKNKEIEELKTRVTELTHENESLSETITNLKQESKELQKQNAALHNVVDKYVYPEMASVLLQESGYIQSDTEYVDPAKLRENTITSNSHVKSESKIIEGMFKKFED